MLNANASKLIHVTVVK